MAALTREPLLVLAASALLAWAMHSSIAAVLVIAALANAGLVGPVAALTMILGANLGSAVNPLIDALSGGPAALRLPVGNLINRLVGCALALPFLPELAAMLGHWELGPGRRVVTFHLLLNVALAVLFFFLLPAHDARAAAYPGRATVAGRPSHAALSGPGLDRDTDRGAGQRGAGDAPHGRCR